MSHWNGKPIAIATVHPLFMRLQQSIIFPLETCKRSGVCCSVALAHLHRNALKEKCASFSGWPFSSPLFSCSGSASNPRCISCIKPYLQHPSVHSLSISPLQLTSSTWKAKEIKCCGVASDLCFIKWFFWAVYRLSLDKLIFTKSTKSEWALHFYVRLKIIDHVNHWSLERTHWTSDTWPLSICTDRSSKQLMQLNHIVDR